jgi:1-acyl-sn-glycerol-3-phosphate acyltransferase
VDFIGDMTFAQSMLTILNTSGIYARLILLPVITTDDTPHRRELADAAHAAIKRALGYAEEVSSHPAR